MSLFQKIQDDVKVAMKAREKEKVSVSHRSRKKVLKNSRRRGNLRTNRKHQWREGVTRRSWDLDDFFNTTTNLPRGLGTWSVFHDFDLLHRGSTHTVCTSKFLVQNVLKSTPPPGGPQTDLDMSSGHAIRKKVLNFEYSGLLKRCFLRTFLRVSSLLLKPYTGMSYPLRFKIIIIPVIFYGMGFEYPYIR